MISEAATLLSAGRFFRGVLVQVPAEAMDSPGLGSWTVRTLAGHTSRALATVLQYAEKPAASADIRSAAEYLTVPGLSTAPGITERAVAAGEALGADPVMAVDALLSRLEERLVPVDGNEIIHTAAGGMRFRDYLPTRTFELAVHTLDLAAACSLPAVLPGEVEASALTLATQSAARRGSGAQVLLALTGRAGLPAGFSVV